jgi:hypothetical protein
LYNLLIQVSLNYLEVYLMNLLIEVVVYVV